MPADKSHVPLERYDDPPELRTCHDVRRLATCALCGGSGDTKHMIPTMRKYEYAHGRCYIATHGLDALVAYTPMRVLETLTLGDIGVEAMKAIMRRREA